MKVSPCRKRREFWFLRGVDEKRRRIDKLIDFYLQNNFSVRRLQVKLRKEELAHIATLLPDGRWYYRNFELVNNG